MTVKSADKKPEKYIGPDGKPKIRMVPVDKNVTNEVSKGMVGRYLKKATPSAADGGRDSVMGSGKEKQGVKKVINRITGTRTAVDKMTGKAKVPATEEAEKHVFRFSTKTKQGNIHHDSRDHKSAAASIEKRTGEKVQSMTYKGKVSSMPRARREDSDAVKAFLAKGGKIKKLPPAKAQGYHGKDDPGKDMHGVMDKPDTKAMGTRKKVKSMEGKKFSDLRNQLKTENAALSNPVLSRRHADAENAHKSAAKKEGSSNPAAMRTHQAAAHYHSKAREELAAGNHKAAMKHANTAMKHVQYTDSGSATPTWARKAKEASKLAVSHHHDAHKLKEEMKLDESMLGHRDAEKLNGGKSRDPNFKSPESHIDHHHRQTGGHEKSGGDADRHRYNVAKKLGYDV